MHELLREQFLVGITTTKHSDWRAKIKEIDGLNLQSAAVFPTCLNKEQRTELAALLEKTKLKKVPFLHIRGDMDITELDYWIKKYGAKVFNIHSHKEHPILYDYLRYRKIIFIEDAYRFADEKELKNFGGMCLDFSHLENDRFFNQDRFNKYKELARKYKIGCNHISAVSKEPYLGDDGRLYYEKHWLDDFSELDYLKQYPREYFSDFCAIELENSLSEQLKAIDYIMNLFSA